MLTPAVLVTIACLLAMAALMIWLLRRQAKARAAYHRRAAIIAHIRREVDKDAPIVGWMVRDDLASADRQHRLRG